MYIYTIYEITEKLSLQVDSSECISKEIGVQSPGYEALNTMRNPVDLDLIKLYPAEMGLLEDPMFVKSFKDFVKLSDMRFCNAMRERAMVISTPWE